MIKIELTPEDVKCEAAKRILQVAPLHVQQNDAALLQELLEKGSENWTDENRSDYETIKSRRNEINRLRSVSNKLEQKPIPFDFQNDVYWSDE